MRSVSHLCDWLRISMELTYECPNCGQNNRVPRADEEYQSTCSGCSSTRELHRTCSRADGLSACIWCATEDLYIQKDFPHNLGLGIVIAGFVVSTVFWALYQPIMAFAVLLLTAFVDVVLYYLVPDVTICYRCLGQHRGEGSNPGGRFAGFDLAIGERYRQERLRAEEIRARRPQASP